MVQTRHMKKNNITMNDIQARQFHISNHEKIKQWTTLQAYKANLAKEKINYIFNSYLIEFGPYFWPLGDGRAVDRLRHGDSLRRAWWAGWPSRLMGMNKYRQSNRYITKTICTGHWALENTRCPVHLVICRYEVTRGLIKEELSKECQCCADDW